MSRLTAVIFDWAGTTVDHGSLAPVHALQQLFAARGLTLTADEARRDMGIHKKDHIRAILRSKAGSQPSETEVEAFFASFVPLQMDCLVACSAVLPGVPETVQELRRRGLAIGSTTGYTRPMLDRLLPAAAAQGYHPDCAFCPDDTVAGRPQPWMCYLNAIHLRAYPMHTMIKVGDTVSDVEEGRNAGMWTVAIARTGNMIGLSPGDWNALPSTEQNSRLQGARLALARAGADYVADAVDDLLPWIAQIDERVAKGERP